MNKRKILILVSVLICCCFIGFNCNDGFVHYKSMNCAQRGHVYGRGEIKILVTLTENGILNNEGVRQCIKFEGRKV